MSSDINLPKNLKKNSPVLYWDKFAYIVITVHLSSWNKWSYYFWDHYNILDKVELGNLVSIKDILNTC